MVGGALFWSLGLPLPWMLGALFATMAAAVGGLPVSGPKRARPVVVAVIGVLLGSRFGPEVLEQAGAWLGTLAVLAVYILAVGLVVVPFYRFVGRMDWATAYFSGMPGGLAEMIEVGEARGGKVLPITLAHSLRIVLTITIVAFWFRIVQGHEVGGMPMRAATPLSLAEALMLTGSAVVGAGLGLLLRLPAPTFLGPLLVSALLHLAGVSESAPPGWIVVMAQIVLGTIIGCRFRGVPLAALREAAVLCLGATGLTMALAFAFALAMQRVAGVDTEQAVLALAPGGLTEMGLIALAIHADVAFVALHHVVRILLVIVAAPLVFGLVERLRRRD